jgi:hypothetical protein
MSGSRRRGPACGRNPGAVPLANHDVRIAVARVDQARAIFDDVARDRYPTVTAGAAVDRRSQMIPGFTRERVDTTTYSAGFDAFWEIDLFGRVRSAVAVAGRTAESFEAALEDALVLVVADVGRNYLELRGLQQRLAVADRSLLNQRETLRLTEVRRDAGIGEEQDVASAAARVAAIEAGIPPIRSAIAQREHRLAVLAVALTTVPVAAHAQWEIEADPIAYGLKGFSGHLGRQVAGGAGRLQIGVLGADVPEAWHGNDGVTQRARGVTATADYFLQAPARRAVRRHGRDIDANALSA